MTTLYETQRPTGANLASLIEAATSIGSDFEMRQALTPIVTRRDVADDIVEQAVAPRLPMDDDVVAAYRAALDTIGSEFERRRAAAALVSNTL